MVTGNRYSPELVHIYRKNNKKFKTTWNKRLDKDLSWFFHHIWWGSQERICRYMWMGPGPLKISIDLHKPMYLCRSWAITTTKVPGLHKWSHLLSGGRKPSAKQYKWLRLLILTCGKHCDHFSLRLTGRICWCEPYREFLLDYEVF